MLFKSLAVAAGSALGGLARWGMTVALAKAQPGGYKPLATLLANLLGCLVLGVVVSRLQGPGATSRFGPLPAPPLETWWLFLATGFCGGFTTFSTLALETHRLAGSDSPLNATIYVGVSLGLGLAALALGSWLAAR